MSRICAAIGLRFELLWSKKVSVKVSTPLLILYPCAKYCDGTQGILYGLH